jgi:DNA-damage-inducible protein D
MDKQISYSEAIFEEIKHINEYGNEYWLARDLQRVLGYAKWSNFSLVVDKAKQACGKSKMPVKDHFTDVSKMIELAKSASREVDDIMLSRYACYLVVQNGDPRKEVIALGQTYFAVKTRQQELIEGYEQLSEDDKRLAIRKEMAEHNKSLMEAAQMAGVTEPKDYAIFQNKGYQGLYGGLGQRQIHTIKGLKKGQQILDHMGSEELAANLFRATQTDSKLRREKTRGKYNANEAHYQVGEKVRQTIKDLGGIMPENLPAPEKSIRELEKKIKKELSGI